MLVNDVRNLYNNKKAADPSDQLLSLFYNSELINPMIVGPTAPKSDGIKSQRMKPWTRSRQAYRQVPHTFMYRLRRVLTSKPCYTTTNSTIIPRKISQHTG